MLEELEGREDETLATERGRSPSGVASVGGPAIPFPEASAHECFPAAECLPATALGAQDDSPAPLALGDDAYRPAPFQNPPGDDGAEAEPEFPEEPFEEPLRVPNLTGQRRGRRLVKPDADASKTPLTPEQRLLILDTWQRSGLPGGDFAAMVGLSKHTLYAWKKKFEQQGPAGLLDQPRGSA